MMIKKLLAIAILMPLSCMAQSGGDYAIKGVPFNHVSISDQFWLPKIETNRTVTIPSSFKKCEETGRMENFVRAASKTGKLASNYPFDDTDLYKIIEGASFSMSVHPDKALDRYVDSLINLIAKAQEPDGYLYTARTIDPLHPHPWSGKERWVNESEMSHELYNSGHLFEAASAHYLATGKRNLLDIALRNADLLVTVFGPGKRNDAPGHEIVEMGLVRLYRITKAQKYLDLAKFFIDCRGKKPDPGRSYFQDQAPLVQQDEAVGHAVRAGYLYSGVADVAALTGNKDYLNAIDKIWSNMVSKKFYITGGVGALRDGESYGANYELPNLTAYNETCAAIANVFWNYRMFLLHGDAKYIDVMERSLYNNVIAGVSMDGKTFFYPNPLESDGKSKFNMGAAVRQPWFNCSCCPTNLCRFLPSVPGYIYAQKQNNIFVNLFVASTADVKLNAMNSVQLKQQTNYPWNGDVRIAVNPSVNARFAINIRIPGWVRNQPVPSDLYTYLNPRSESVVVKVNGIKAQYKSENGYAMIDRVWKKGDVIEYDLPFNVHRVVANSNVAADKGKVALELGPIVYCLEGVDNKDFIGNITLPDEAILTSSFDKNTLNAVNLISGEGIVSIPSKEGIPDPPKKLSFRAIPYYTWCNRGASPMQVWIPRK
ncbi:MAG: glycoside hydrolase family 127 protein [Bacteroidota bacterium]|nr:glycoside hydrolase family 127 protein [Bacteroidota bacterium]